MLIKNKTIEELKTEFISSLRSNCGDKITKVLPDTVFNGLAFAISKITQKIIKSAAQIEARTFPELANNSTLDQIASENGIPVRYSASKSMVVLLFYAADTTFYASGFQVKNSDGIVFETKKDLTVNENEFGFVVSESLTTGSVNNVEANTLTIPVTTAPVGHVSVTNTFKAINGRDQEAYRDYQNFILNIENILSKNTEAYYDALVRNFNREIIKVYSEVVIGEINSFNLYVVKNNAADLSSGELTTLKNQIVPYTPLSDNKFNILNVVYTDFDMIVPVRLITGYILADVLKDMQVNIQDFMNLTNWDFGQKLQWDDLLEVCKNTEGIEEVFDSGFYPNSDIQISDGSLPRLNNFTIENVDTGTTIGKSNIPSLSIRIEDPYESKLLG